MRRIATWSAKSGKPIQILRPEFKRTKQKWCVRISLFWQPGTVFDEKGEEVDGDHQTVRVREPIMLGQMVDDIERVIAEMCEGTPKVRDATAEYFA